MTKRSACQHLQANGRCGLGAYELPSPGTCYRACEFYSGPESARRDFLVKATVRQELVARKGCGRCGRKVVRWLGVRWYGTPMPVRLWWRIRRKNRPVVKGCGCLVKAKAATEALARAWKYWRAA